MKSDTVSEKGQILLDADLLAQLGVRPGDKVLIEKLPGGVIRIRAAKTA